MGKPNRGSWEEPVEMKHPPRQWESEELEETAGFLDEAHEAMARLYNKTVKRGKHSRSLRKNEGW